MRNIFGYKILGTENWILRDGEDSEPEYPWDSTPSHGQQQFSDELVKAYFRIYKIVDGKHWWNERQKNEKISMTGYYGKKYVLEYLTSNLPNK